MTTTRHGCGRRRRAPSAWDWTRWSRHFAEADQAESYAFVLCFQLEEAVALKGALLDATISNVMAELKSAREEQRYEADQMRKVYTLFEKISPTWMNVSPQMKEDQEADKGIVTYGKIGEWRFDKRSYQDRTPPRILTFPNPGVPESVECLPANKLENYTISCGTWPLPHLRLCRFFLCSLQLAQWSSRSEMSSIRSPRFNLPRCR